MNIVEPDVVPLYTEEFPFIEGDEITALAKSLIAKTRNGGIKTDDIVKFIEILEVVSCKNEDEAKKAREIILPLRILEYHMSKFFFEMLEEDMERIIEDSAHLSDLLFNIITGSIPAAYIRYRTCLKRKRKLRDLNNGMIGISPLTPKEFGPTIKFGEVEIRLSRLF